MIKCALQYIKKSNQIKSNVGFRGEGKTGAVKRTNKLSPHMTPSPGIEPGPHWWKASALITAPILLPILECKYLHLGFDFVKFKIIVMIIDKN